MVRVNRLARKKLGQILVQEGLLKKDQLDVALQQQKESGELLGEILIKLGLVSEVSIAHAVSKQFGLPYIDVQLYQIPTEVLEVLPAEMMYKNQFIILDKIGKILAVVVSGVIDPEVFEEVEKMTGSEVFLYVSTVSMVMNSLKKHLPAKQPST